MHTHDESDGYCYEVLLGFSNKEREVIPDEVKFSTDPSFWSSVSMTLTKTDDIKFITEHRHKFESISVSVEDERGDEIVSCEYEYVKYRGSSFTATEDNFKLTIVFDCKMIQSGRY